MRHLRHFTTNSLNQDWEHFSCEEGILFIQEKYFYEFPGVEVKSQKCPGIKPSKEGVSSVHPLFEEYLMGRVSNGSRISLTWRDLKMGLGLESGKKGELESVSMRGQVERGTREKYNQPASSEARVRREFEERLPIFVSCLCLGDAT